MTAPAAAVRGIFPGAGELASRMRSLEWSKTAVGPPEQWPESLRTAVRLCLASPYPVFLTWGPSETLFYNDACLPLLAAEHPRCLGEPFKDAWPEVRTLAAPLLDRVRRTAEASTTEHVPLVLRRNGPPQETFLTFSCSPLLDEEGRSSGHFWVCIETPERVLRERRLRPANDNESQMPSEAPASKAVPPGSLLVALADVELRDHVARMLSPHWAVETVDDGNVAFEKIVRNPPDLVLLDDRMQVLAGFDLLRQLRSDSRASGVPVLLLSDRCRPAAAVEVPTLAADDCMARPFTTQELITRVEAHLEFARLRRATQRSENKLRLIADAIPALISYVDVHHRYVFNNKAYEEWFGVPRDRVAGRPVREILGEKAYASILPHLEKALLGKRVTFEVEVMHRSGTPRFNEVTYIPDIEEDGAVAGVFVLVLDMTQRKKAEQALRESEERFRKMTDHAPVMIYMLEADGTCSYLGQPWYEFTGQTAEAALGFGWMQALHPDDWEYVEKVLFAAMERRGPVRVEYRLRRQDGQYRWALDVASPRFGPGGEFLGFVGSVIDITDLKRIEEEIRDRVRLRTAELETSNRELESFSYTVAHDLRSPLRAMHRYGEILRETYADRPLDEEGLDYLARIESSAKRMDVLIEGLLALTRLSRAEPASETADVETIFGEALVEVEADVAARGADVRFDGPSLRVRGDRLLLRQVLTNFLSNAVKFVPPDRRPIVRVTAEAHGDRVRTTVRDNGVGFPPESRSKLFRIFERLESAKEYAGTGIGLAIAKKAAERMGGRVGADGVPGDGSLFWIDLPRPEAE